MRGYIRSRRYAQALFGLAEERGETKVVLSDMEEIISICEESQDFRVFIKSPIINPEKKEEIFTQILGGRISELSMQFVLLLTRKGREGDLQNIANAYIAIYNVSQDIKRLELTTATELPQEAIDRIVAKVKDQVNAKELETHVTVDPDLIGGFVVQVEDRLFDASVRRDLNDIEKQFKVNNYESNFR